MRRWFQIKANSDTRWVNFVIVRRLKTIGNSKSVFFVHRQNVGRESFEMVLQTTGQWHKKKNMNIILNIKKNNQKSVWATSFSSDNLLDLLSTLSLQFPFCKSQLRSTVLQDRLRSIMHWDSHHNKHTNQVHAVCAAYSADYIYISLSANYAFVSAWWTGWHVDDSSRTVFWRTEPQGRVLKEPAWRTRHGSWSSDVGDQYQCMYCFKCEKATSAEMSARPFETFCTFERQRRDVRATRSFEGRAFLGFRLRNLFGLSDHRRQPAAPTSEAASSLRENFHGNQARVCVCVCCEHSVRWEGTSRQPTWMPLQRLLSPLHMLWSYSVSSLLRMRTSSSSGGGTREAKVKAQKISVPLNPREAPTSTAASFLLHRRRRMLITLATTHQSERLISDAARH